MTKLFTIECDPNKVSKSIEQLVCAIELGKWVQLSERATKSEIPTNLLPKGPGVVIKGGGSSGQSYFSLQPKKNLDKSAEATREWLKTEGLNPKTCLIVNALALHHISGLMPWWRSQLWGAEHLWLSPSLMRDPALLEQHTKPILEKDVAKLISLVPIQVQRLLSHPAGIRWLKMFEVIWVGGASLPEQTAKHAKQEGIRLAPCYGSTETASMVTVLAPHLFLAGKTGCGSPLEGVQLGLSEKGALKIKTSRLSIGRWEDHQIKQIVDNQGWWNSGDAGLLINKDCNLELKIKGRIDNAINSGGVNVFPEELEMKLMKSIEENKVPIQCAIFIPIDDKEWGERLIGLIRPFTSMVTSMGKDIVPRLNEIVREWSPAERPVKWLICSELETNSAGKWERSKWRKWLSTNHDSI